MGKLGARFCRDLIDRFSKHSDESCKNSTVLMLDLVPFHSKSQPQRPISGMNGGFVLLSR
jgi:hypothetical protein